MKTLLILFFIVLMQGVSAEETTQVTQEPVSFGVLAGCALILFAFFLGVAVVSNGWPTIIINKKDKK